jgi:RNA polymerase sigma-70 factor (ECF subfamily)
MKDDELRTADDDALLELIRGDGGGLVGRKAASELFSRHHRRVYLWCRRYSRDHERAMELAQDVMLKAYRALPGFEGRARFSSWLFAIARNLCLNATRFPGLVRDPEVDMDQLADSGPDPEEAFAEYREEARLRDLLQKYLDEDERRALWLRCYERMPVDEIGRVLRLENATGARALLQRARRRLRAGLGLAEEAS